MPGERTPEESLIEEHRVWRSDAGHRSNGLKPLARVSFLEAVNTLRADFRASLPHDFAGHFDHGLQTHPPGSIAFEQP